MKSNVLIIAKKEYLKIVQKLSFWILLMVIPVIYLVLVAISGSSAKSVEKKVQEEANKASIILVADQSGLIDEKLLTGPFKISADAETAIQKVKDGQADALFIYPADILESKTVKVYAPETSMATRSRFTPVSQNLLKQSILEAIGDPQKIALAGSAIKVESTLYKDGAAVDQRFEKFIIPIISVLVYFLLVMFSSTYMLSSVSEEKENRMIETMLSIVKPRQLIWGKIIGLTGVSITQLVALAAFMSVIVAVSVNIFPIHIDWSAVNVNFWQVVNAVFYIVAGFVFLSSVMVGVGAAMPRYRDAQQFSSVFIMLSIIPIYFASILIAEPSGAIARIISFTPFTAPLILLFRSSVGALPVWESVLGMAVVLLYVFAGFYAAFKLFEIGSLELSKKISIKTIFEKEKVK